METNKCENTHPMLPIDDNCVGNIKLLNVENKDLIIQDLKDVIVDLNSNDAVKIRNKETIINNEKYFNTTFVKLNK